MIKPLALALSFVCVMPAFAETQLKEAPYIASDKKQLDDDKKAAHQKHKEGLTLLKQKRFYDAVDAFYEATTLDPDNAHYHNQYGLSLLKSRDAFSAVGEFETALELGLNKAFVWNNLGMAYEHSNQLDDARNAYMRASQKGSTAAEKNYQRIKNVKSVALGLGLRGVGVGGGGCGGFDSASVIYLEAPIVTKTTSVAILSKTPVIEAPTSLPVIEAPIP